MKKQNYWTWQDSELQAQLEVYKIELPGGKYDRRLAIEAVKAKEKDIVGKGYVEDPEGKRTFIEEMKDANPTLELRKVIFHSTGEHDLSYVFVGHNGLSYYIPKEMEIEVPVYILNSCIKDAVEHRMYPKVEQDGTIVWLSRRVQRFPYSYAD